MNFNTCLRPWRQLHVRALLTITFLLALVMSALYVVSIHWLAREQMLAQQRRARDLLRHVSARLELGVMVNSPDLIRPIVQEAFVTPEIKGVAVYGNKGALMLRMPEQQGPMASLAHSIELDQIDSGEKIFVSQPWSYWLMARTIECDPAAARGSNPIDFQIVDVEDNRVPIGAVVVYWDLTPLAAWLAKFQKNFLIYSLLAFMFIAVPTWLLLLYYNRGINQLFAATKCVQRGDFNYRIHSNRRDQIGDVMRAFDSMMERTQETTRQLEEQRQQAVAASQAKSDFLANMSHELRTPLNAIIGFSEVLLEPIFGELNDKQRSYVNDILDSGNHLLALINDILDLSKIEAGKMEFEPGSVDLPKLLAASLRLVAERAARHQIELILENPDQVNWITADERKLKQLIFNLLSNAVKFTPDGGKVGIRTWMKDHSVMLCVWDTGIGIPASEHDKIFQDFYQVGNSLVKSHQGTGLGLSLVRKIAELHGGSVWVESAEGAGAQFYVELPQPITHDADRESVAATPCIGIGI